MKVIRKGEIVYMSVAVAEELASLLERGPQPQREKAAEYLRRRIEVGEAQEE